MLELFFEDFIRLFAENPIGQSFGFLGMIIILIGFFQTDDKKTKSFIAFAMIAWILHFFFMGYITAAIAGIIGFIRLLLSLKFQRNIYVFLGVITVSSTFGYFSFESIIQLIPIIASILGSIAFFFLEKIKFRILSIVISFLRLFYHIQIGSVGGMLTEVLTEFILVVAILRIAGRNGHLHHFQEKIHDIMHGHHEMDLGTMVILKDSKKIIKKEGYFHKLWFNGKKCVAGK